MIWIHYFMLNKIIILFDITSRKSIFVMFIQTLGKCFFTKRTLIIEKSEIFLPVRFQKELTD